MKLLLILFIAVCGPFALFAQRNLRDSIIGTPWVAVHYGGNWTAGDLADRFGFTNHLGAMAGYKTKRNWVFGLDGNFMFGNTVRLSGLFEEMVDSYGHITDENGDIGIVVVNERGFNVNTMIGKVFPILSPNANSGLYVHAGVGYLQHRLKIETQDQYIPQLEKDYRKGYDRFTSGVDFHEFVGYAFLANQGIINFYGGFYAQQGLTRNRREVFFDQPDTPVPNDLRLDLQFGFKIGWFVPVYQRKAKEFYYN
jgi:hypothetical protein